MKRTMKKIIILLILFALIAPFLYNVHVNAATIDIEDFLEDRRSTFSLGSSKTETINGITYALRTDTTNYSENNVNRATVISIAKPGSKILDTSGGNVYLNIPQTITSGDTQYMVDTIGDGNSNSGMGIFTITFVDWLASKSR